MGSANQYQADDDNASTGELHQLVLPLVEASSAPEGQPWHTSLHALAVASFSSNDGEVVRAAWEKHHRAASQYQGSLSACVLNSLRNTAHGYSMQGDYPNACRVITRVADMLLRAYGGYEEYARLMGQCASYTMIQGSPDAVKLGVQRFAAALEVLSSRIALPPDHPTLVSVVAFIAKVMRALAPPQSELAETMFQFVDDTIVELCGEDHILRIPVLLEMGRMLNARGDKESGTAKARAAWAVHEARSRGEDSDRDVVAADVACFLGIMTSNVGDGLEAIEWLRRSTKIFTAALSQTSGPTGRSRLVRRSRHNLAHFLYFPHVYGELAVRLVAAGDVPAAEQALIGGGKVVATFRGVVGYEQAHASLERYWPAVHPSAS